jgi:hypothetical protein
MNKVPNTPRSDTPPTYLTPAQAARILHRKPYPVLMAIRSGKLRAWRPDDKGPWLITPADLTSYVEGGAPAVDILSPAQLAQRSGTPVRWIRRELAAGRIRGSKVGRRWYVPADALA